MDSRKRIESFEDLIVWQKANLLWEMACENVVKFPNNRIAWVLNDQLLRSIGSVSANIAEGHGSGYSQEYLHSLRIARKELSEALNWLIKSERLGYITTKRLLEYRLLIDEVRKMLNSLIGKINQH